jgi:hypothetical protein
MLNYSGKRKVDHLTLTCKGPFARQKCEEEAEEAIKHPIKQLYLQVPQKAGPVSSQNSPRSTRTSHNSTANLSSSFHTPIRLTPTKNSAKESSFQQTHLQLHHKPNPISPSSPYSKQNSFRARIGSSTGMALFKDISNTHTKSNLQLR